MTQPTPDSAAQRKGDGSSRKSPGDHLGELKELVVGYAKQETIDPLRSLGRYLGMGIAGSILIGTGICLTLLGILRFLQTLEVFADDGAQPGALSLVPYAITLVVGGIVIGIAAKVMTSSPQKRRGGTHR